MSQLVALAAGVETELTTTPFLANQPAEANSVAGGALHATNLPAKNARNGNYQKFNGPGATSITSTSIVNLANAHVDGGTLNDVDVLRVIVKINGVIQKRVAAAASPSAGQFKTSGAGPITLTFGASIPATSVVEIFLREASEIAAFTLVANTPQEVASYQVMRAVAASTVSRLTP